MKIPKSKSITELRNSLFETFDEVVAGEPQMITHKNGSVIAMVPLSTIEEMASEIQLHKNLAFGYAQAMRGEGISSQELKRRLQGKEKKLRERHA